MKLLKKIRGGEMIPPFYGVAWFDYSTDGAACLPVPLNIIVAILRQIWIFLKHGGSGVLASPRMAYGQGYAAARKHQYIDGYRIENEWHKGKHEFVVYRELGRQGFSLPFRIRICGCQTMDAVEYTIEELKKSTHD